MRDLRAKAQGLVDEFLDCASEAEPRDAADLTLAAKNAMSVVLMCIQAEATKAKIGHERSRFQAGK